MAEYIKREDAEKVIETANRMVSQLLAATMELCMTMHNIAAADVVEVVRCRDCLFEEQASVNSEGHVICPASGMEITDDDYCSYGLKVGAEG